MKTVITNFKELDNNQLYSSNFFSFVFDLYRIKDIYGIETADDMFEFILKKMKSGRECIFNSSFIKGYTLGNKNTEFHFNNIENFAFPMKKKINSCINSIKRKEEEKERKLKEGIVETYGKKNNAKNKEYIEKIMTSSYENLQSDSGYNARVVSGMGINNLVFYDLETTTSKELLLGYFTFVNTKGEIKNSFLLNEKFEGTFFAKRVEYICNEINKKYNTNFSIPTYFRFMDEKYKENFMKSIEQKKNIFIGFNSIAFDNMVMARHMKEKGIANYFKLTDEIHNKINKVSMDLFEFYSEQKENCALDVILKNNLKGSRKLMNHEELLPMLSYDFLNNPDNINDIDGFIYYNIFDVLLIVVLFFQNFKKDSFGYRNIVSKEIFIDYVKRKLLQLDN